MWFDWLKNMVGDRQKVAIKVVTKTEREFTPFSIMLKNNTLYIYED